jgi:dienelactone hydrolase
LTSVSADLTSTIRDVVIPVSDAALHGQLAVPRGARGLVVFAHGSGSSRFSPRNQAVAAYLRERGLATLLFDLLSASEEEVDRLSREYRFDIPMLSRRLVSVVRWLGTQRDAAGLAIGLFGSSTGAAAALIAAALAPGDVSAVVSRGGRPDLAADYLPRVRAPTLMIVGDRDRQVVALNEQARARMTATAVLTLVPGATHLFEEPGTLEQVMRLAADWMLQYLPAGKADRPPAPD